MTECDLNIRLFREARSVIPSVRQLKQLLVLGADINYQNAENGYTALMFAVAGFHDRIVEYLLQQGANPLIKNHNHKIASELIPSSCSVYPILKDYELLFATSFNEVATVKRILDEGALVNYQDADGNTPLMIAVKRNLVEMVELLFHQGADLSLVNKDGQNSFDLASGEKMVSLLNHLQGLDLAMPPQPELIPEKNTPRFFTASRMKKMFN
ncbi:TPA: ankyrin repeat domain-containing protein [Legionella feeleii]